MNDCFVRGIFCLVVGIIILLSSVTKIGRDFDRAYLKALPGWMRMRRLEPLRNPIGTVAGVLLIIGAIVTLVQAVYSWWTGRIC